MRHAKSKLQFNRFTSWRRATLIGLAKNILVYESIKTTRTKAKAVKPLIEKLVSLAKKNTLAAKRQANQILNDHLLVKKLFGEIGPRFENRPGGYARIIGIGRRRGDNAELAVLELSVIQKKEPKKHKKEKEAKPVAAAQEQEAVAQEAGEQASKPLEQKPKPQAQVVEKDKKPPKKFLGGIKNIFKKERDSL